MANVMFVLGLVNRERRRQLRRERLFRDRRNPMEVFDDLEIFKKFRFDRANIYLLVDMVSPLVEFPSPRRGSLPALLQVLLTLRFYACGTFQDALGELIGVSQPTVSRAVRRVTRAFVAVADNIRLPNQQTADRNKQLFLRMGGMPQTIGCIDGTHVRIQAPRGDHQQEFMNRKNFYSINVQIICGPNLQIMNCVAKWAGSVHDARILRESDLFEAFERNPKPLQGFFLGDSGYMLRDWLITPFLNPANIQERRFNEAHCSTRNAVERCIGVLKRRWHCLHCELRLEPERACQVIYACAFLHNCAINFGVEVPMDDDINIDHEIHEPGGNEEQGNGPQAPVNERARALIGRATRQDIVRNFFR